MIWFLEEHAEQIANLVHADQPLWEERLSTAMRRVLFYPENQRASRPVLPSTHKPILLASPGLTVYVPY